MSMKITAAWFVCVATLTSFYPSFLLAGDEVQEQIESALARGYLRTALRLAFERMGETPEDEARQELFWRIAKIASQRYQRDCLAALADKVAARADGSGDLKYHYISARLYELAAAYDKAIEHYVFLDDSPRTSLEGALCIARALAAQGHSNLAVSHLERTIADNDSSSVNDKSARKIRLLSELANLALQEKNIKEAERYASNALESDDNSPLTHLLMGEVYLASAGMEALAEDEFRKALSIQPREPDSLFELYTSLKREGKSADAKNIADSALMIERGTRRAGAIEYELLKESLEKDDWREKWKLANPKAKWLTRWIPEPKEEAGGKHVWPQPGRKGVLKVHPITKERPIELIWKGKLEGMKRPRLYLGVCGRYWKWACDCLMTIIVNNKLITEEIIDSGYPPSPDNWYDLSYDLSDYAGKDVEIRIQNRTGGPRNPWWGEELFIDYIHILDGHVIAADLGR